MKKKVYITSVGAVSTQNTNVNEQFLEEIITYNDSVVYVNAPNYKDYIPPAAARRMAKGIKMSTVSAKNALTESQLNEDEIDAIIVGTGLGCIGDSEKFVCDIINNNEQYLTPTRFIQSSHNTVAGQIALNLACKGHNFTFVHSAVSFEVSLIDAQMQLEEGEANHILVGGVDELSDYHIKNHRLITHIKTEAQTPSTVLQSNTKGAVFGEGSHFFILSNKKQASTYAELIAVKTFNSLAANNLQNALTNFLLAHDLTSSQIDAIVIGTNGDVDFDHYYNTFTNGIFDNTLQVTFKHLSGEYDTATGFAFWLANNILKLQKVPAAVIQSNKAPKNINTILIYNQYRGENHSFTLLQKC